MHYEIVEFVCKLEVVGKFTVLDICAWLSQDCGDLKCGFLRGLGGSAGFGVQMRVKPAKCGSLGRYDIAPCGLGVVEYAHSISRLS